MVTKLFFCPFTPTDGACICMKAERWSFPLCFFVVTASAFLPSLLPAGQPLTQPPRPAIPSTISALYPNDTNLHRVEVALSEKAQRALAARQGAATSLEEARAS